MAESALVYAARTPAALGGAATVAQRHRRHEETRISDEQTSLGAPGDATDNPPGVETPPAMAEEPPTEEEPLAVEPSPRAEEAEPRSLYRHPLAAVGGAIMAAGSIAFVLLIARDLTASNENPYRALVTFIGVPTLIFLGLILFLIAIRIQVVAARRRGENVRFALRVEPTDPHYMRSLWLFLGLSVVGVLAMGYVGFRGYETTESAAFCGETCHEVMGPEYTTHQISPHARVECVECHIGSGASYWVKSKIDGVRQVLAVALDTFERPLEGPFELRPARETCEECHWPEAFLGDKIVSETYWSINEENTPWSMVMLLDIGRESRTADPAGIHWHMLTENVVEYIATDPEREEIPWVRVQRLDGSTAVYTRPGDYIPGLTGGDAEVRQFDCLDCHNRPSHTFESPSDAINSALSDGRISAELPYIKRTGLRLLTASYPDREDAHEAIRKGIDEFYRDGYPELAQTQPDALAQAARVLLEIYDANFFPEMKTDFRARHNNLGHRNSEGCFRCHDGSLVDELGKTIASGCNDCHLIIGLGPGADPELLETNLLGIAFEHQGRVGDQWQRRSCASCHAGLEDF